VKLTVFVAMLTILTAISGASIAQEPIDVNVMNPQPTGTILREWWTGIPENPLIGLTESEDYPDNPTGTDFITTFEGPINFDESYGTRVRGYIHPPTDGGYAFWIACDDTGELWLSTDNYPDKAVLIANVPEYVFTRQWEKYPEQRSSAYELEAGKRYYIELLHKEGIGRDHFAVAWQGPGINQEVIPGGVMSPYVKPEEVKAVIIGIIPSLTNEDDSLIDDLASYSLYTGASSNEVTNFAINFPSAGPIPTDDEVIAPAIFIDKDTWVAATAIDQAGNESVLSPAILCCDSTMRAPTTFLLLEVQVLHTTK